MDSQKNENILNLALDTSQENRERSLELNVGFDDRDKTWEVIVKYHGSLQELTDFGIVVEELIAGYAILTVPESEMERLPDVEQIEYVEIRPPALHREAGCHRRSQAEAFWWLS